MIEVQISTQEFLKIAKNHSNTSLIEAEFQINNLVNKRLPFAKLDMSKPHIMGVINLTPDSFYKNSQIDNLNKLKRSFYEMINNVCSSVWYGSCEGKVNMLLADKFHNNVKS